MGKEMGRPKIEINKEEFEKLCALHCTKVDIADWFGCSDDTIERWCKRTYNETFAVTLKNKSVKGRVSLRRTQFRLAEKSPAMAIWLGKQYLGQRDEQEIKHSGEINNPMSQLTVEELQALAKND